MQAGPGGQRDVSYRIRKFDTIVNSRCVFFMLVTARQSKRFGITRRDTTSDVADESFGRKDPKGRSMYRDGHGPAEADRNPKPVVHAHRPSRGRE